MEQTVFQNVKIENFVTMARISQKFHYFRNNSGNILMILCEPFSVHSLKRFLMQLFQYRNTTHFYGHAPTNPCLRKASFLQLVSLLAISDHQ